tara:strand:- start:259 stop:924 length:666 start_codon:yes stop_codon:yes gene_type:complete
MLERFFDIFFVIIALIVLFPLFVIVIFILLFTGEKKVFFVQKRLGRNQKIFGLVKFATMLENSPNMSNGTLTIKNDPRILPFGKFLRKSKINELPQLINVLFGHMSLVGPRPLSQEAFDSYTSKGQKIISGVKPGLTGIGSIIFRDEENLIYNKSNPREFYNLYIQPYKEELELWYIENRSLKIYFLIIFITAWIIFFPQSRIVNKFLNNIPQFPNVLKKY